MERSEGDRAPVDLDALDAVLAPLGQARSLPADAYTSKDTFAWEMDHFFDRSWPCVGRTEELAHPGAQTAVAFGSTGILLVRGTDGELRAFHNVCRHRGHELVECGSTAQGRVIRCPYHAWVYGLDGELRAAPRFHHLPADDPVHDGLVPVPAVEWHGWLFVNPSADGPDFPAHVGDLGNRIGPYQAERLTPRAALTYEVAANWKLIVENYHECYHCPNIHPELCRITPSDSGRNLDPDGLWCGGSMDLKDHAQTMSLTGRSDRPPLPGITDEMRREVLYFGLFPNLLISLHPDYVLFHRIEPLAPDHSRVECGWLFPSDAGPEIDPSDAVEFWDITNKQDWRACESVQRGVASRGYRPGPLAMEEDAVHQFLTMVARGYLVGRPVPPS